MIVRCEGRVLTLLAFLLGAVAGPAPAADPPGFAVLKAAGGNVATIKGGGTSIVFRDCKLDDQSWKALESLRDLKTFTIFGSGKEFGDEQLARLCEIKTIESIFMNAFGGTEAGLASLAKLPNLHYFGADHSPFTGKGLVALKDSKSFRSLRLGGCPFDDEGMKALGELTQLKEANVSHVRFTSAGFSSFAKLANLEKLTISANFYPYYVGADFVHLSGLKNLNTLIISEMALGYEDGLDHLKGLKLKRLELRDCRVSDGDLQRLRADLPDAAIERIYSIDEKFKGWDRELDQRKKSKTK
jgi:hypothetical protein